LSICMILN